MSSEKLNPEVTAALKAQPEYIDFLRWADEGGIVHPSIDFPAAFGPQGLKGILALSGISSCKAFLFVPYKLCMGVQAANKALMPVFDAFPELFHEHKYKNELRLYVFVMSEKLKGEKSFYYPYLRLLKDPEILMDWSENELIELQDPSIFDKVLLYKHKLQSYWLLLQPVFLRFPSEFPPTQAFETLFKWTYKIVQTRSFAWGDPEGMLIPYADFFNHADVYVSFETCSSEFLEANKGNEITYVDYRDFSGTPSNRSDLAFGNRTHSNKLVKYLSSSSFTPTSLLSLDSIWSLEDFLPDLSSSDDDYRVDLHSSDEDEPQICDTTPQTEDDYFVVSTGKRGSVQAGEQVCICYGRQNNLGLLMFYGFAMSDYQRDAAFIDIPGCEGRIPTSYRIKLNKLNEDVIAIFRKEVVAMMTKSGVIRPDMARVMGLTPILNSLEQEAVQRTVQFYTDLIATRFTTTEDYDRRQLHSEFNARLQIATVYRLSQREILKSQVQLLTKLGEVLREVEKGTWEHALKGKAIQEIEALYPLRNYLRAFNVNQTLWEKNFFT